MSLNVAVIGCGAWGTNHVRDGSPGGRKMIQRWHKEKLCRAKET